MRLSGLPDRWYASAVGEDGPVTSTRGRQTVGDMLRSMGLVGIVVALLFLVVWWQRPEGLGDDVRRPVDPAGVVAAVRMSGPFAVLEPVGLGSGWTATSAWFEPHDDTTGAAFLHLGYTTPAGSYAQVRQTDAPAADVVGGWTAHAEPTGEVVRLAGLSWRRLQAADGALALVARQGATADGVTLVVTGKAGWDELEELAGSLR